MKNKEKVLKWLSVIMGGFTLLEAWLLFSRGKTSAGLSILIIFQIFYLINSQLTLKRVVFLTGNTIMAIIGLVIIIENYLFN